MHIYKHIFLILKKIANVLKVSSRGKSRSWQFESIFFAENLTQEFDIIQLHAQQISSEYLNFSLI